MSKRSNHFEQRHAGVGGGLCEGETRFKPKALRRGEEGALVSEQRLLSAQVAGLRSSCHNSCDVLILQTCQERRFSAQREISVIFREGGKDHLLSVFTFTSATLPAILTPSLPTPQPPVISRWAGSWRARTPGSKGHQTFPRPPGLPGPGAGAPPGLGAQPRLLAPQSRGPRLGADLRQTRSSPR